jgi:hypothetical protein
MPFQPGQSGNPEGGRLHNQLRRRASSLARQYTEEAIDLLVDIMRDEKVAPGERLRASIGILDRGWGRPPVATSLYFEDDEPQQEGTEEERVLPVLASILADIAEQEEKRARKLEAEQPQTEDAGR